MEATVYSLRELNHFPTSIGFKAVTRSFSVKPSQSSRLALFNSQWRSSRVLVSNSRTKSEAYGNSTTDTTQTENAVSVNPVYVPTPTNRQLRTPHSGYHFDGSTRKFFEGWYFKVSIPERKQSFCFMYTVENPAFQKKLSALEIAQHGPRFTGVGAQILGAYDKYICQYTEESRNFWGSRHELMLGNTFSAENGSLPPNQEVPPQEFNGQVMEGFQVTPALAPRFYL